MKALTDFRIVLSDTASYHERRSIAELLKEVEAATSVKMTVVTDAEPAFAGDLDFLRYLGERYGVTYIDRLDIQSSVILDYLPDFIELQEIQEGTVNRIEGYMHTELMKRIGHEYTEVNLDEFVPTRRQQWTPIFYRTSKWELLEARAATNEEDCVPNAILHLTQSVFLFSMLRGA